MTGQLLAELKDPTMPRTDEGNRADDNSLWFCHQKWLLSNNM